MSEREPIIFKLKYPIERRNKDGELVETITEFTIRKPRGKVFKAVDGAAGEGSATLAMLAGLAGVPKSVMDEIDLEDMADFMEVCDPFLVLFRRMDGKSSER